MSAYNRSFMNMFIGFFLITLLSTFAGSVSAVEKVTYYHNDALGSPVAATDAQGSLLWEESYEPYGRRLLKEDNGKEEVWFTGKQEESDFDVSYFGARWYDPSIGRFLAIDPVGVSPSNIHSFNRYTYVNNNPYRYVDPDGRAPCGAFGMSTCGGVPRWGGWGGEHAKFGSHVKGLQKSSAKAPKSKSDKKQAKPDLPALDSTGKVHGQLPRPKDLKKHSNDELSQLRGELKQSVQQRIKKNIEHGSHKPHGERQAAEQQLIKSIDKVLGN